MYLDVIHPLVWTLPGEEFPGNNSNAKIKIEMTIKITIKMKIE